MKKLLLFSIFSFLLISCDKNEEIDPDYPFTIVVKTIEDSTIVTNIRVGIYAPSDNGVFKEFFEGWTNELGEASFEYDNNAVFTARAQRGAEPSITHIGCADVRLEPNKRVYKTVYIRPYDNQAKGCDYIR
jgi:hypothetical protein